MPLVRRREKVVQTLTGDRAATAVLWNKGRLRHGELLAGAAAAPMVRQQSLKVRAKKRHPNAWTGDASIASVLCRVSILLLFSARGGFLK